MAEPGTLQRALVQVAEILRPLEARLTPDRLRATLADLGIDVGAGQAAGLSSPAQALVVGLTGLLEESAALTTAIDADDTGAIVAATAGTLEGLATTFVSLDDLEGAVAGLGVPGGNQLGRRLFNSLLVEELHTALGISETLELLAVLDRDGAAPSFHFDELAGWIEDPRGALEAHYGWGTGGFDAEPLMRRLAALLEALGAPVFFDDEAAQPKLDFVFFELAPSGGSPRGLTLTARQSLGSGSIEVAESDLGLGFTFAGEIPFGAELTLRPPFDLSISRPPGAPAFNGLFEVRVEADRTAAASKFLLLGQREGSRLEVARFALVAHLHVDGTRGQLGLRGELGGGKVRIGLDEADGFLGRILAGAELESDFDLGFGYRSDTGLFFEGSSSLEIELPTHLDLGPVEVSALRLSIGVDGGSFPAAFTTDVKAALGPLVAVVEGIGLRADLRLTDDRDGNAGPLDVDLGFQPPTGVGLAIDAGAVRGGGFLSIDVERGEYAGVLELSILELVRVTAIGVITTKMPDGSSGFAFIAILSVEFNPGLQLGFGFTLVGVGGLVGLNRTVELEAIAQGARSGAIDSILFPKDVVANATRILSDLRTFFPPEEGTFLVGPMAKLGWGTPTLISLSLGVIILPGTVAVVGKLTVAIPDERLPLIIIQVAFIGALELDKKRLWFSAVLYESRVVYMPLDGGMGVLAAFGNDQNFVVSVGGFHPSYDPPSLPFPSIPRIAINILNTPVARIRVEAYFAVTSNTVQFGAHAELYFGIKIASVEGHLGFDALFMFSPFYFIITISASLSVKLFGAGLFSVRFKGSLEGTSPWHVEGTGSISILWWDVDVDFSRTWGEEEDTRLPPISVLPLLKAELEKLENWTAVPGGSNHLLVTLRTVDADADLVLHPVGSLRITQRAIPLGVTLDKVGSQRPDDADRFTVEAASEGIEVRGTVRESFAMGQFRDMGDAEKLSAADFEKQDAGLELSVEGNQTNTSLAVKRIARYEQIVIDDPFQLVLAVFVTLGPGLFTHFLAANTVAQAPISAKSRDLKHLLDDKVSVQPNGFVVVHLEDNTPVAAGAAFTSRAGAQDYVAAQAKLDPEFTRRVHIVRPHEAREAA